MVWVLDKRTCAAVDGCAAFPDKRGGRVSANGVVRGDEGGESEGEGEGDMITFARARWGPRFLRGTGVSLKEASPAGDGSEGGSKSLSESSSSEMITGAALRPRVFRFGLAIGESCSESELSTMSEVCFTALARLRGLVLGFAGEGTASTFAGTSEREIRRSWLTRRPCASRTTISTSTTGEVGIKGEGFTVACRRLVRSGGGIAGEPGALGTIEPSGGRLGLERSAPPNFRIFGDFFPFFAFCEDFCTTETLGEMGEFSMFL